MKLRILNNSIRLRLSQSEVSELAERKPVSATTQFPGGTTFSYCVEPKVGIGDVQASFVDGQITVSIPTEGAYFWAVNDRAITLRSNCSLPDGGELDILVEKDFKCLTDRPHEDESDLYPHPKQGDVAC